MWSASSEPAVGLQHAILPRMVVAVVIGLIVLKVVACIAGCRFGVRRKDMEKLLLSTRGKVFTLRNMGELVDHTRLAEFRSR